MVKRTLVARGWRMVVLVVGLTACAAPLSAQPAETMKVPLFGTIVVYRGSAPPDQVVLFISGDGGWNLGVIDMANRLRNAGALVVGIDIRTFMKSLEASGGCAYPAGALEELSRAIQLRYRLPSYKRPILVGYSSGATLVYAAIAAAPPETFAGAISLGFCADLEIHTPLCQMRGLSAVKKEKAVGYDLEPFSRSTVPWMVLQGGLDQVCSAPATERFVRATGAARLFALPQVGHGFGVPARWGSQFLDAYRAIAAAPRAAVSAVPAAPAVADLSLVEVPAIGRGVQDTFAVVLSGDGGWADLDKHVAAGLAAAGIPTVGWSSLEYYWTPRTPEAAAADLARIIDHYAAAWQKSRVLVVGYSFGADATPFLVNRLPASARGRVKRVALLGPSDNASFEFHLASWFGGGADATRATLPEIERLATSVTCISADEADSVCRRARNPRLRATSVGTGHHFSGDYPQLVAEILR